MGREAPGDQPLWVPAPQKEAMQLGDLSPPGGARHPPPPPALTPAAHLPQPSATALAPAVRSFFTYPYIPSLILFSLLPYPLPPPHSSFPFSYLSSFPLHPSNTPPSPHVPYPFRRPPAGQQGAGGDMGRKPHQGDRKGDFRVSSSICVACSARRLLGG